MLPALAANDSLAGANALAQFWFLAWDWAYATGDATLIEQSSATSCSDCDLVLTIFDEADKKDQHFRGGRLKIVGSRIADPMGRYGSTAAVDVTISQNKLEILGPTSAVLSRAPATRSITFRLWMKREAEGWIVVQKGRVGS